MAGRADEAGCSAGTGRGAGEAPPPPPGWKPPPNPDPPVAGGAEPPDGSTMASTFHCTLNCSASACRSTSSLPLLRKLSRAPAFTKPICSVVPSKPTTCAFWLSRIQVKRRRFFTASRTFGQSVRGSRPPEPGVDAAGAGAAGAAGEVGAVGRPWAAGARPPPAGAAVGQPPGRRRPPRRRRRAMHRARRQPGPAAEPVRGRSVAGWSVRGRPGRPPVPQATVRTRGRGDLVGSGADGAAGVPAGPAPPLRTAARAAAAPPPGGTGAASRGGSPPVIPPCTSGPGTYPIAGAPPPEGLTPRSRRSRRAMTDRSSPYAAGNSTRAQINSSCSRGEVAPRISVSPSLTRSAARLSSAGPKTPACACMRSSTSAGASMSPFSTASGTAATITRSRNRSSRSATNRRGSLPPSMTRSTTSKAAAPSRTRRPRRRSRGATRPCSRAARWPWRTSHRQHPRPPATGP